MIALPFDITPEKAAAEPSFDQRWSSWGGGFGGYGQAAGSATVGSNTVTATDFGAAAGMDYRVSPNMAAGFALAGGGTSWGLAQGLGSGRSDAFQAGLYSTARGGGVYVASAFSFTNHWMSTDRFAFAGDHLTADFDAMDFGGRLEAGYRLGNAGVGVTPYAAGQARLFAPTQLHRARSRRRRLRTVLQCRERNGCAQRSRRARRSGHALLGGSAIDLWMRAAWAHDWVSDPSLLASFAALPGASFTVTGALPASNSALLSTGTELHVTPSLSFAAKFETQLASGAQSYAGSATMRYVW